MSIKLKDRIWVQRILRYTCFADELLCNALHPADDTSNTRNAFFASLCHIDYQGKTKSMLIAATMNEAESVLCFTFFIEKL